MTDFEMAKEYATENGFASDCNNLTCYDANTEIERAYLAGLKAGRLQWHKDKYSHNKKDKPLPCGKVEGYYRVILYDNYKELQIVRPETEIEFVGNQREHIIAWCEIPKYTEE